MSDCRAKFFVSKVTEFGDSSGRRSELSRIKKHVPAGQADPDDGTIHSFARTEYESTGVPYREITLSAVCDGSEENRSFADATPTGTITFTLSNLALADLFKPGENYYVDFTKAAK